MKKQKDSKQMLFEMMEKINPDFNKNNQYVKPLLDFFYSPELHKQKDFPFLIGNYKTSEYKNIKDNSIPPEYKWYGKDVANGNVVIIPNSINNNNLYNISAEYNIELYMTNDVITSYSGDPEDPDIDEDYIENIDMIKIFWLSYKIVDSDNTILYSSNNINEIKPILDYVYDMYDTTLI